MALPLCAFTLIESVPRQQKVNVARGDAFRVHVRLDQLAEADGSVKLQPGEYNVEVSSMGDGSVRASFFDMTGRKVGEAHGIAIIRQGAATSVPAVQSPAAALSVREAALHFAPLGFDQSSRSSTSVQGNKLNLEISSRDGSHGILIGLLVPAVQKIRQ